MKKLIISLLAVSILLLLAACTIETPTSTSSKDAASSSLDISNNTLNTSNSQNSEQGITFRELIVADTDDCMIKITNVENNIILGFGLKVQLENKSSEKTYMFSLESAAINGVECTPFWASEVAAGKKSNDTIYFLDSDLQENGIVIYTDIELAFRVYDSEDWTAEDILSKTVHVFPYGEENATHYVREVTATDNTIIDNQYVTVIVTGYNEDSIWGYSVDLFIVNKTDTEIMVNINDASVNGYMADPFFAKSISPNKCAFSSVTWFASTLEENNISKITELEFTMRVYDNSNWFADDFANEKITLNP